jgi:hypothetical protein
VATEDDEFRKPAIGIFEYLCEEVSGKFRQSSGKEPLRKRSQSDFNRQQSDHCEKIKQKNGKKEEMNLTYYITAKDSAPFGLGYTMSKESFFCGDAAGRSNDEINDFSSSDVLFALNTNLNFILPEQLFLKHIIEPITDMPAFQFEDVICKSEAQFRSQLSIDKLNKESKQNLLILLVGSPGCGKTHFADKYFEDMTILSYVDLKEKKRNEND